MIQTKAHMIFDELILENFGVYRGRQVVNLAPAQGRPIVLFGGLNGGGKTTLMDAIKLVLYGKLASCSNRANRAYRDFLRDCIHQATPHSQGAAVELTLRKHKDGVEHQLHIKRSWADCGSGIRESVAVHRDGVFDAVLSEQWLEFMEELLPNRLAHLFFFDGERIEAFADVDASAELLRTGIHSLLGLDLVDQLTTDLKALERRKTVADLEVADRETIKALECKEQEAVTLRAELKAQQARKRTALDRGRVKLGRVEKRFEREGGHLFEQRVGLEQELVRLAELKHEVEEDLRKLAHDATPMFIAHELLAQTFKRANQETDAVEAFLLASLLGERDEEVLTRLREHAVDAIALGSVQSFLEQNRRRYRSQADIDRYLELDPETKEQLAASQGTLEHQINTRRLQLLERFDGLDQRIVDQERRIASIPAKGTIAPILKERDELKHEIATCATDIGRLNDTIGSAAFEAERAKGRYNNALERFARERFVHEDARRLVSHAKGVRSTLDAFREAILHRHIARIELLILESFQTLIRKTSLVDTLSIDPVSFRVTLSSKGRTIAPNRLSAGERQLLAISMLWGLAKAAGHRLPVVVDTPMGRLDSKHRQHLVERYFPHASHQVLLLSTDEEIDERYFEAVTPAVCRTYHLNFDDESRRTTIEPGYFWGRNDEPD